MLSLFITLFFSTTAENVGVQCVRSVAINHVFSRNLVMSIKSEFVKNALTK
jgi:hypothetical protein